MAQNAYQRAASDRVAAWLAANQLNASWLAEAAKIDPGTVGDFLAGSRWPKNATQGKIERALGWPAGSIHQIGRGGDAETPMTLPTVGGDGHTPDYVSAPGARVESGVTNEDLLREILRSRAEYDQLAADVRGLHERVARLEERS